MQLKTNECVNTSSIRISPQRIKGALSKSPHERGYVYALYMQSRRVAQPVLTLLKLYLEHVLVDRPSVSRRFRTCGLFLDLLSRRARVRRDVVDIRLLDGGGETRWHRLG